MKMQKRLRNKKMDLNRLAKSIVDQVVTDETPEPEEKDAAKVSAGRLGGLKGGKVRAANLSAKQRSEIARKAAEARWLEQK